MTDKTLVKQRQKQFRTYAVPIFPIQLTRLVAINGQAYQMIGQQTSKSLVFTIYDVIDEQGNRAPEDIQQQVYTYTTTLQMAEHFCFYIHMLEEQKEALRVDGSRELMANYHNQTGKNIEPLITQNEELLEKLTAVQEELTKVAAVSESGPLDHFQNFFEKWDEMRFIYEQRIPDLMSFRSFVINELEEEQLDPNGLDQLYEEATMTYDLFHETIPTEPAHLIDIDEFIKLNGMLGHIDETKQEEDVFSKPEQFSYMFFSRITYIIALLIGLVIVVIKGISVPITLLIGLFFISSGSGHLIKKAKMINTVMIRVDEQRKKRMTDQQTIHEKYQQAYHIDPAD